MTFSKSEEMELAVTQLHNREVDGVQIKVEVNRRGSGPRYKQDQMSLHNASKQLKVHFWPAVLSEVNKIIPQSFLSLSFIDNISRMNDGCCHQSSRKQSSFLFVYLFVLVFCLILKSVLLMLDL